MVLTPRCPGKFNTNSTFVVFQHTVLNFIFSSKTKGKQIQHKLNKTKFDTNSTQIQHFVFPWPLTPRCFRPHTAAEGASQWLGTAGSAAVCPQPLACAREGPVSRGAAVSRGAGLLTTAVVRSKGPDPPLPPSSSRQGRRGRLSRGVCSHIRPEIRPH